MAIKINNSSYYSNYQRYDTDGVPYDAKVNINIDKGGVVRLNGGNLDVDEEKEVISRATSMKELIPHRQDLRLNDLRITIRDLQGSTYALIYNKHNNELLKTMPHEDFVRKIGLMGENQVTYFEVLG